MKKLIEVGPVAMLVVFLALGTVYAQPMGPGMMGQDRTGWGPGYGPQQQQGWTCPYCGRWYGPGYGYGPQYQQPQKPMTKRDAEALVGYFLKSTSNPNLKLGKIQDEGTAFEVEIVTKTNSLVDKILVDKRTGWMRSVY
jgi:hypothetical protein